MKKRIVITLCVLAVASITAYLALSLGVNSPQKNKEIEIKAFQESRPELCNEIKGNSYTFGPTDAQISVSQAEAQKQCREHIEKGTQPVLHGG